MAKLIQISDSLTCITIVSSAVLFMTIFTSGFLKPFLLKAKNKKQQFFKSTGVNGHQYRQVPGSIGWPIVGHLPYMSGTDPYPAIEYYKKKYGPIFQLQLGSFRTVIMTDYSDIKRLFATADLTDRPPLYFHERSGFGFKGVGNASGTVWKEQRTFALRHLHDTLFDCLIDREIAEFTKELSGKIGEPFHIGLTLDLALINIVWSIVASHRMSLDDNKFLTFARNTNKNFEITSGYSPVAYIPWLIKILPNWMTGEDSVTKNAILFANYAKELIEEHKMSLDPENPRDFIDHFLVEKSKRPLNSSFTDLDLLAAVTEFFSAGGETIYSTLRWAILLISGHTTVQGNMRKEIHKIIGCDRQVTAQDQVRMPYVTAVIMEVQRFGDLLPFGNFRCNNERDVIFKGYLIPKGTMVGAFLGGCHRDPKYWEKPNEFYPEHFLNEQGQIRDSIEGFFPFSTGRRSCIGERLAKKELFLFLVNFFQKFKFRLVDDPLDGAHSSKFDADPTSGIFRWAPPYQIIVEKCSDDEFD